MIPSDFESPSDPEAFRPTASLEILQLRSELLAFTRAFFRSRGFWEVETPLLSRDVIVDAYIEPFVTRIDASADCKPAEAAHERFLQTSPEFAMKRLLASGASRIFQITRAFRREELGRHHNPEFTMVEWYEIGATYHEQMDLVEELVFGFWHEARKHVPTSVKSTPRPLHRPFTRLTYDVAFAQVLGRPVIGRSASELAHLADSLGIHAPASLPVDDVDGWLNLLLAFVVEPELARQPALFLYDYPPGQSALARIRHAAPPVAERFELYLSGIEICNGYQELTNPDELRRRIAVQAALRRRDGRRPLPAHSRLIDAMQAGLPECAGVALGFDRLLMAALGAESLADVMPFPFDRA